MPINTGRWLTWSLYALLLIGAPWLWSSSASQSMLSQMGIAIIACLSYNMLFGQGGMLSFGHAVYTGMGGFIAMHALNLASRGALPLPVSLVPLVGGLGGFAVAMALGWVTTKKSGTTFAMITLGIGELVWAMSPMFPAFFGGEGGISGNRVTGGRPLGISFGPQIQLYYLIAAYTFVSTALMFAFTGTPLGRMLNAVRDNPERAEFIGYDAQTVRYIAFVVAGFFAGHRRGVGGAQLRDRHFGGARRLSLGCLPVVHVRRRRHLLLRADHRGRVAGASRRSCCQRADQGMAALPRPGVPVHGDVRARAAWRASIMMNLSGREAFGRFQAAARGLMRCSPFAATVA